MLLEVFETEFKHLAEHKKKTLRDAWGLWKFK